ncbi:hypothetical protein VNO80_16727 [Phaseolus coccineus]|uniref:Uncharacterized protein n=1 Tax=Phaseolus coccineus TaxID=3886 RepID=A0AAN9R3I6_PHACN
MGFACWVNFPACYDLVAVSALQELIFLLALSLFSCQKSSTTLIWTQPEIAFNTNRLCLKIIVGGSFRELKAVKAGRRKGKEIPNTIKLVHSSHPLLTLLTKGSFDQLTGSFYAEALKQKTTYPLPPCLELRERGASLSLSLSLSPPLSICLLHCLVLILQNLFSLPRIKLFSLELRNRTTDEPGLVPPL